MLLSSLRCSLALRPTPSTPAAQPLPCPPSPLVCGLRAAGLALALLQAAAAGAAGAADKTRAADATAPAAAAGASDPAVSAASAAPAPAAPPGAPATVPAPAPLQASGDGGEIIDTRARLAWLRCAEGMQWSGSGCTGRPLLLDRSQASARALQRSTSDGQRWRLPRVNELRRLVNKNATPPGLDAQLFPAAPLDWHWSGTTSIRQHSVNPYNYSNLAQARPGQSNSLNVTGGWAVHLATGAAQGDTARSSKLLVRLVRPLDSTELP